jgi:hypothetical protein
MKMNKKYKEMDKKKRKDRKMNKKIIEKKNLKRTKGK